MGEDKNKLPWDESHEHHHIVCRVEHSLSPADRQLLRELVAQASNQHHDETRSLLLTITQHLEKIMATVDDLVQSIADQKGQIASLKALTTGIKARLDDALKGVNLPPTVQAKVDAAFKDVNDNTAQIVDAINQNDDDPNTPPPPPTN